MNNKHIFNHAMHKSFVRYPSRVQNNLHIERIEYIKNPSNKQLIVLAETIETLSNDIHITVNGSMLIIEAIKDLEYNRPFHNFRLDKDKLSEFEDGGIQVAFGEIELKKHHKYTITDVALINHNLIKIILSYDSDVRNNIFYN